MDNHAQQMLMDFLTSSFDTDGKLLFLAVSALKLETSGQAPPLHKVRIAVTFQEDDYVTPYFDGTDLYVEIGPNGVQFAREEEWADGPPIVEGSPNELALGWVSELAPPFWVSPEALRKASKAMPTARRTEDAEPDDDFDRWL